MTGSIYQVLLSVCWGTFILIWLGGWIYNLAKAPKVQRKPAYIPVWIISVILIFLISRFLHFNLTGMIDSSTVWMKILGIALLIPSTALTLWARFTLGTMWSEAPETKVDHQLRTEGPYRISRHPIYTGTIGMLLGTVLLDGTLYWILFMIVGVSVDLIKVPVEEKLMIDTFGEEYRKYQQRIPQIVPGLQFLKKRYERK